MLNEMQKRCVSFVLIVSLQLYGAGIALSDVRGNNREHAFEAGARTGSLVDQITFAGEIICHFSQMARGTRMQAT